MKQMVEQVDDITIRCGMWKTWLVYLYSTSNWNGERQTKCTTCHLMFRYAVLIIARNYAT